VAGPSSAFKLAAPALSGDMVYDLRVSALGYGPSYTIGNFGKDQMFSIKGMWVIFPDESIPNKLGAGVAVSIPKALKAIGVQNIPDWFTLEIGVMGLLDIQDEPEASVGLYATLIKIPF
jgi:hypothetical protein